MFRRFLQIVAPFSVALVSTLACAADPTPPEGFTPLFNGKDLTGWKGLLARPHDNPFERAKLTPEEREKLQAAADEEMRAHWSVQDGVLVFDGKGRSMATAKDYRDFELYVDWKIEPEGDSGIYLRGTPQVQIWDPDKVEKNKVGSGGLFNNKNPANPSTPRVRADKPVREWNTFHIKMIGERVWVRLNEQLVVDGVVLENYWDKERKIPIFPSEQIELQNHGNTLYFDNIFIREISDEQANIFLQSENEVGFAPIFNGKDFSGWTGAVEGYEVRDGLLACKAEAGGLLHTQETFADFTVRYEFRLPPGGNNGLAIRTPAGGHPATDGFEIQVLDDHHEKYNNLKPYQFCGSIYGLVPAPRGYVRPAGQWNFCEVTARGPKISVKLNGTTVVDADVSALAETPDGKAHPGIQRTDGHIGFAGHKDPVEFRNIRVKKLN